MIEQAFDGGYAFRPKCALNAKYETRVGGSFGNIVVVDVLQVGLIFIVVEIEAVVGHHYYLITLLGGNGRRIFSPTAPPRDGGGLGDAAFYTFVPTNHLLAVLGEELLHLIDKPRLQFVLVFKSERFDASLAVGALFPVFFSHLVAANVYIFIREKWNNLLVDVFAEFESRIFARTHRRRECLSPTGFGKTSHSVVVAYCSQHMPRHIYFGNHIDTSFSGISHHIFYLFLGIEATVHLFAVDFAIAVGWHHHIGIVPGFGASEAYMVLLIVSAPSTFLGEERVALDFDAPTLVVGEMPV